MGMQQAAATSQADTGSGKRALKQAEKRFELYYARERRISEGRSKLYGGRSWVQMTLEDLLRSLRVVR
jgi:hypothetical protein